MARREFQFIDGTSKKFWHIDLVGKSHTVHFGRIGTAGQSKTKEFASEADAEESHDKLVAAKLKEGYKASTGGLNAAAPQSSEDEQPTPAKKKLARASKKKVADDEMEVQPKAAGERVGKAVEPPGKPAEALEVTRTIDLDPDDWFWATWRKLTPLQRKEPPLFDMPGWIAKAAKIRPSYYGLEFELDPKIIGCSLCREEAKLWFLLLTERRSGNTKFKDIAALLTGSSENCSGAISFSEAKQRLVDSLWNYPITPKEVMLPLANLFPPSTLLALITEPLAPPKEQEDVHLPRLLRELARGYACYIVPFLHECEKEAVRATLRPLVQPSQTPSNPLYTWPPAFYLAARLGLGAELAYVTALWPESVFRAEPWHHWEPQFLVFGRENSAVIESEFRRLGMLLNTAEQVRAWLACTNLTALDLIRESILTCTGREAGEIVKQKKKLIAAFALVRAPEAAEHMLTLWLDSKVPIEARQWLQDNLANAIAGLIPTAAGRGKLADAATQFLRDMKKRGHGELIEKLFAQAPAEAATKVRQDVIDFKETVYEPLDDAKSPPWLKQALQSGDRKKLKPPTWVQPTDLPPLTVGSQRLNDNQVAVVLHDLQTGDLEKPPALFTALKQHADRSSLDAFAWRLFERWLQEGAPSKEKWAMASIGFLGGDLSVLKITPLIRAWPGESQHQRAVFGLECLRAVGTDTALMQLNGISQKLKFKGLKNRAMECMEAISQQRGMTRAELEDCIVPDCDLDERGNRLFDFGSRQFTFVLGQDMKPLIRDEAGKLKGDLPKPTAKDDTAKANAALDDWKLLKKTLREVLKVQTNRLEQAMVVGRRWPLDKFQVVLVRHPLMTHLARRLLWGVYDDKDNLTATFRVTEEQDLADVKDDKFDLAAEVGREASKTIGIVHAAHLSKEAAGAWGEVFSDYEIIPPFQQLGRPIYGLEPGEETQKEITRFTGPKIPAITMVGILDRQGWMRGVPQDGGAFLEHCKPFYGANVTAVVEYDGIGVGYTQDSPDQQINRCYFIPGIYTPKMYPEHKNTLELSEVHPVVLSEVLRDLAALAAKGT